LKGKHPLNLEKETFNGKLDSARKENRAKVYKKKVNAKVNL